MHNPMAALSLLAALLVTLSSTAPAASTINVPPAAPPTSISAETHLNLFPGGELGDLVRVRTGGELNILGGTVGRHLTAEGGSVVNLSLGQIGGMFDADYKSVVNVSGGTILGGFRASGKLNVSGGTLTALDVMATGSAEISGGSLGLFIETRGGGGTMKLIGGQFQLDGSPIAGLRSLGDSVVFNPPEGGVLTGVLADGTPFSFSTLDRDTFATDSLTLETVDLPPIGPSHFTATMDRLPRGLRHGQTLEVDAGGVVQNHFNASYGSTVNVRPGGSIGYDFEAVGSTVNLLGGSTSFGFGAFQGAVVNVEAGTLGSEFDAFNGSTVNVSGGNVGQFFAAHQGSTVNISGGTFHRFFSALDGSVVNLSGGTFDADFDAFPGSTINFLGTSFLLDGQPVEGLRGGEAFVIEDRDVGLSGFYPDGTPFYFFLNSVIEGGQNVDSFSPNSLVTITLVPEPAGAMLAVVVLLGVSLMRYGSRNRDRS